MKNLPLISIITPLYNSEKYVAETIKSVQAQTYANWELVIVDDGSTDNSYGVVSEIANGDTRIQLYKRDREPKGCSTSRNIGIEKSKGDYILFLDSDDLLYPHCLENRVRVMRENPDLDFAVFQMEMFTPTEKVVDKYITIERENYLQAFLSYANPWAITCPFWRRDFFRKELKGFDEGLVVLEDPKLHTRALLVEGVKFKVLPQQAYLDCAYRIDYKPHNLSNLLKAVPLYISSFLDTIKSRADKDICFQSLVQYYETILTHYSGQLLADIYANVSNMSFVNEFSYENEIINKKQYYKTKIFLFFQQNRMFENKGFISFLNAIGYKNFYIFKIQNREVIK